MRIDRNRWIVPLLIMVIVAAAGWIVLPNNPGISVGSFQRSFQIVRGLDLQGGLRVLLQADLPPETDITGDQMQTARDIVENRVNGLGVTEPIVQVVGGRRILVELPGVEESQQAIDTIQETGLLEFVDLGDLSAREAPALHGRMIRTDYGVSLSSPDGNDVETEEQDGEPGEALPIFHTVMTGTALKTASVVPDTLRTGEYVVNFELTEEGTSAFADFTRANVGRPLAIVLDGQVISAPVINEPITAGAGSITGGFTFEDANNLAVVLRYGSLPVPLEVIEIKSVGPTLGQDSLRKSTVAGVIGMGIVMAFMALYYRLPGVLADVALFIYAVVTFAAFKVIPVTLTLPAIAGFVLSIGVAVDANILIFERMKEELRAGRALRQAIDLGFSRAWPSIRDSNFTTLITCTILYWFGNTFGASIVKGFAITLAIGVLVSLFTAITITRTLLHLALERVSTAQHARLLGI